MAAFWNKCYLTSCSSTEALSQKQSFEVRYFFSTVPAILCADPLMIALPRTAKSPFNSLWKVLVFFICYGEMYFNLLYNLCNGCFCILKVDLFRLWRGGQARCCPSRSILKQAVWNEKTMRWKQSYWGNRSNSTKSDNGRRRRAYKRRSTKARIERDT